MHPLTKAVLKDEAKLFLTCNHRPWSHNRDRQLPALRSWSVGGGRYREAVLDASGTTSAVGHHYYLAPDPVLT
jgi:hypothetical protein